MSYQESIEIGRRAAAVINKQNARSLDIEYLKKHIVNCAEMLIQFRDGISFECYDDARAFDDMNDVVVSCAQYIVNPD